MNKKLFYIIIPFLTAWLFIGYYETRWVEDDQTVLFIKKSPSLKLRFINVFSSDHEDNWSEHLEERERQYAIDFCKYYVGYKSKINTMDDYHQCEHAYRQLKRSSRNDKI